jgi:hypothetical protein
LASVSLRWKVVGLAVLLPGLLTIEGILALSGKPSDGVTLGLLAAGYLAGGAFAFWTIHHLSGGVRQITDRLDAYLDLAVSRKTLD